MDDNQIDQQLVKRAQAGDHRAFNLLVSKYQRRLNRLLLRLIKDEHDANDIAQETFIKAYKALPNFRGESSFYTWLYRIGLNTAKNFLATSSKKNFLSSGMIDEEGDLIDLAEQMPDFHTPESAMMNQEILQTVESAVASLPEDLRNAIILREMEGLSYEEIATIMDCPVGTVRSRIFRAREIIAKDLRPLLDTPENQRW